MVTSRSIEALPRGSIGPILRHIALTPAGSGHMGHTGPDPKGFRLIVSEEGGKVVALFNAETLEVLDSKVRRYIESEDTLDGRKQSSRS